MYPLIVGSFPISDVLESQGRRRRLRRWPRNTSSCFPASRHALLRFFCLSLLLLSFVIRCRRFFVLLCNSLMYSFSAYLVGKLDVVLQSQRQPIGLSLRPPGHVKRRNVVASSSCPPHTHHFAPYFKPSTPQSSSRLTETHAERVRPSSTFALAVLFISVVRY